MQLTILPDNKYFASVEKVLQSERLSRYFAVTSGDKSAAFAHYMWNCDLSQSFYIPLHFAEIGSRNAIHCSLLANIGPDWFNNKTFQMVLGQRFAAELADAVKEETAQHGAATTAHHIVSALTFGFWEHLLTKRFERLLWTKGVIKYFPGATGLTTRDVLRDRLEAVRRWRNRIAHHRAIFDKSPSRKYQEIIELIDWTCPDTCGWLKSVSHVQAIINQRPV